MDLKVFEFLGAEVPSSVGDIREALDLFTDEAADKINRKWNIFEVDK